MIRATNVRLSGASRTTASRPRGGVTTSSRGSGDSGGHFVLWSIIGVLILVLDQATKFWFEHKLDPGDVINILPGFNFVLAHNYGAAFSLLAEMGGWQRWLFSGLAFFVACLVLKLLRRYKNRTLLCLALTLLGAGAVGNLCDRVHLGYVIDFIDLYWRTWHWPAFNVADIAICMGATGIVLDEFVGASKSSR